MDDLLLFYDARNGRAAVGTLGGEFEQTADLGTSLSAGWSHICRFDRFVFFYDFLKGAGSWFWIRDSGLTHVGDVSGLSRWSHVVRLTDQTLLFYDVHNGASAVGWPDARGEFASWILPGEGLSPGWTHIVSLPNEGGLFFYNGMTGAGAFASADFGAVETKRSFPDGSFSAEWTHVVAESDDGGNDRVLFYQTRTGEAARLWIDSLDATPDPDPPELSSGWTHAAGRATTFFYNRLTGEAGVWGGATYGPGVFGSWTHVIGHSTSGLMPRWGELQGFCWPPSARPGGTIDFHLSTAATSYSVRYVSFHNVAEATPEDLDDNNELLETPLTGDSTQTGQLQNTHASAAEGCGSWQTSFELQVPHWRSGLYAARCEDSLGAVFYIPFVVRPSRDRHHKLAVLVNVNTWNAYNPWGGASRYSVSGDAALSYLRPNFELLNPSWGADHWDQGGGYSASSKHLARAELWVLNWLAEAGYSFDVFTDLDFHAGIEGLDDYAALILSTHPEYWSLEMHDRLKGYLDRSGRLLYLGGNGIFDSVTIDGTTMNVFGAPGNRTRLFRDVGKPEGELLGVAYVDNVDSRSPYVVQREHALLEHIDALDAGRRPIRWRRRLEPGDLIGTIGWNTPFGAGLLRAGGASGWEVDQVWWSVAGQVEVLARGTNPTLKADMVLFRYGGNGFVFSVGSISFGGSLVVDGTLQQIVRNALDSCLAAARARRIITTPAEHHHSRIDTPADPSERLHP